MNKIKTLFLIYFLILLITGFIIFFIYGFFSDLSKTQQLWEEKSIAVEISNDIRNHYFENIIEILSVFSEIPSVREGLTEKTPESYEKLNRIINKVPETLKDSVVFVMDSEGNIISGTPYNKHNETFVGKNFSYRKYFTESKNHPYYIYPALGGISNQRGIYISKGVFEGDNFLGVIVVKISLIYLESTFITDRAKDLHWGLRSPEGIIFATENENYLYKYLNNISERNLEKVINENQFPAEQIQKLGDVDKNQILDINGEKFIFQNINLGDLGWDLVFFNEVQDYRLLKRERNIFVILCGFLLIILFVLFLLIKMISKQIKTELTLREYSFIVEQSPLSILITDSNGKIEYLNGFFKRKFNDGFHKIIGKSIFSLGRPNDASESIEDLLKHVLSGNVWEGEICSLRETHKEYWELVKIYPLLNQNKEFLNKFIVIGTDITENKHFKEESLRLRSRLSGIINSMPSLLIGLNKDLEITLWNREAEKLFGYDYPEVQNRNFYEKLPEMNFISGFLSRGLKSDTVSFEENRLWIFNDKTLYIDLTLYPIENGEEFVLRIDDVTSRFKMQTQLVQTQKMDAVGQLAGGMAHDFNNILAGIMGAANILEMGVTEEETKDYISIIIDASERARDLIAKVMSFSRHSSDNSAVFNPHSIIDETLSVLKNTIDKKIEIEKDFSDKEIFIEADPTQIQNVFLNLGINASHAMPEGGKLIFKTSVETLNDNFCKKTTFRLIPGDFLKIEVSDNGTGIPHDIIDKIFDPFFTTKKDGNGTGLGLSAVYGIIKESKGAIFVQSTVGKGSLFSIYFPLSKNKNEQENSENIPNIKGSGKILLVDDEKIVRDTSKKILENLGYKVETAENGEMALDIFYTEETSFDLIILDMIMPKMNGVDCLKKIRSTNSDIPVIVSSGFSHREELEELKFLKVDSFLSKPFRKGLLSQTVFHLINKRKNL